MIEVEIETTTDHKCPWCKKEYNCYLRNEYNECPLAYYEPCEDCKLKRLVNEAPTHSFHPERKPKLSNIIMQSSSEQQNNGDVKQ